MFHDCKVKICGLTNLPDALAAVAAGADYLGFIFAAVSPRYVTPEQVREILAALPPGNAVRTVGVFMNADVAEIRRTLDFCGLDLAQLHGEESASLAVEVGLERVWKMMPLRTPQELAAARNYPAAAILADTVCGDRRGGTGETGNWELAAQLAGQRPVVLAGGLRPENVRAAIAAVHPFAVDVASGVEAAPGRKDYNRVRKFITEAKQG